MDDHPSRRHPRCACGRGHAQRGRPPRACGDDDNGGGGGGGGGGASGGSSAEGVRDGGSLRVGVSGGGPEDSIDAHVLTTDPDIARAFQLYEPLAVRNPDYELEMLLAESIEADKSPDEWTIRLRDGVNLPQRQARHRRRRSVLAPADNRPEGPEDGRGLDLLHRPEVLQEARRAHGPHQAQAPNVGFPDDVGQYFNGIVPTDYDPKNPVGTGPFKYKSFSPGQRSVFVKNADYWREGEPHVDEVTIIDFPDDTARVNALLGQQVDAISNLPAAQIARPRATPP